MMYKIFWFNFFLFKILASEIDLLNEEDPCLYQHVNVITGQLNLHFQDAKIESEIPLSLSRGYSSLGGLEKNKTNFDLKLKELRGGFLIQGGWNFFSYTNLLIYQTKTGIVKAYVSEPDSGMINYEFQKELGKKQYLLKPNIKIHRCFGNISARNNISNNELYLNSDEGIAILQLPNGTKRTYLRVLHEIKDKEIKFENTFYRLIEEILPSGHIIDYFYDKLTRLTRIESKSPDRTQVYGWIDINVIQSKPPFQLLIKTSDGKSFYVNGSNIDDRDYLGRIRSDGRCSEFYKYEKINKENGWFLKEIYHDKNSFLAIDYGLFESSLNDSEGRVEKLIKVKSISVIDPRTNEKNKIAEYEYFNNKTVVTDVYQNKIEYFFENGILFEIRKFKGKNELFSSIRFIWDQDNLIAKVLLDSNQNPIFSKTFLYDINGNVIKETFYGDLTGANQDSFLMTTNGSLDGADHFSKYYTYDSKTKLLIEESEDFGCTYIYKYVTDSDLLHTKLYLNNGIIFQREGYVYNKQNLLIQTILDDGHSDNLSNIDDITFRKVTVLERDKVNGKIILSEDLYYDNKSNQMISERIIKNTYDSFFRLVKQDILNKKNETIFFERFFYNINGKIELIINSLGQKTENKYDNSGNVIYEKKIGLQGKKIKYDSLGRAIKTTLEDSSKDIFTEYDIVGNPIIQIDERGQKTEQYYDNFGNCIRTVLPANFDEKDNLYFPEITYEYDIQGNLVSITDVSKKSCYTEYTAYRKPKKITYKDGSCIYYEYYPNGLLKKTILQDGSYIFYTYDILHRILKEEHFSSNDEKLICEEFEYNSFFIISHKNKSGLLRNFEYDYKGRKTIDEAENRRILFYYDEMDRVIQERYSKYSINYEYNSVGIKTRNYQVDNRGRIEKDTYYKYDNENRLIEQTSITSCGFAVDKFDYDNEWRLVKHIDPAGAYIKLNYKESDFENPKIVFQKCITDSFERKKIESYDSALRIISIEILDEEEKTVNKSRFYYDQLGNQKRIEQDIFNNQIYLRTKILEFDYDVLNRKIEDIEDGIAKKWYEYDLLGNITKISYPSGKSINYIFDSCGQLKNIYTDDKKNNIEFFYHQYKKPYKIVDLNNNNYIERDFNIFGELICEKDSLGHQLFFNYDELGRVISKELPDKSYILYEYEKHLKNIKKFSAYDELEIEHEFLEYNLSGQPEIEKIHSQDSYRYNRYDLLNRKIYSYSNYFFQQCSYDLVGQMVEYLNNFESKKRIEYDSIGQLKKEGNLIYEFDSIGNPKDGCIGIGEELLESDRIKMKYDLDGNLIEKNSGNITYRYFYDSLNRLVKIRSNSDEIELIYDPLSRLIQIKSQDGLENIFYEGDIELGCIKNNLICGLKIYSDLGEVLYIQQHGENYLALLDFQGSIRGKVNLENENIDYEPMNFFGFSEKNDINSIWGFSSQRKVGKLYYFGQRFYDPEIKRWISRDPLGYAEGYNLYAFVINKPTTRVDLFGLLSDDISLNNIKIPIPMKLILDIGDTKGVFPTKGFIGESQVDWVVACGHWHKVKFTPEEIETGVVNVDQHLNELIPANGKLIGLITAQNGIMNSLEDFHLFSNSIINAMDSETLFISLYNNSEGFFKDIKRVVKECNSIDTKTVIKTRQFMEGLSNVMQQINPEVLWAHIAHSEAGAITRRALEGMQKESQNKIRQHLKVYAFAPVIPVPKHLALETENFYSDKDYITGPFGVKFSGHSDYNISFYKCISGFKDRSVFFSDHAFLGKTYQSILSYKFFQEFSKYRLNLCLATEE